MESRKVIVGTRKSELALVQTELIVSFLQERFPNHTFEIKKISTCGDKILDVALSKIGDKSLFTKELEVALLSNEIDFIVHSLKDVPTEMPEGTVLGCICNRVSPFDVVLMSPENRGKTLKDLPPSAVVGSSALRRIAQLRKLYPHLTFQSIRGNLNTRLAKLDGTFVSTKNIPYVKYDAIILAKAGVDRLGWGDRIDEVLSDFPYAVSQGALACECRQGDEEILSLLSCIHHEMSALSAIAERSFMRRLQGGCCTPIAVSSFPDPSVERSTKLSHLALTGTVMNLDASKSVTKSMAINLPFNCNFKLKSRRRRGKKVYSDTSGYSTSSSSGSTGFYNDELYDGDFQLISNAYDESTNTGNKRKRKAFYKRCAAGQRRSEKLAKMLSDGEQAFTQKDLNKLELRHGMSGFLVTFVQRREREAAVELYRLLADVTKSSEQGKEASSDEKDSKGNTLIDTSAEEDNDDSDDDLLASLRKETQEASKQKFDFNRLRLGVNSCMFVLSQYAGASSSELVSELFQRALDGKCASKFLLRIVPVAGTCRANLAEIEQLVATIWRDFVNAKVPEDFKPYPLPWASQSPPTVPLEKYSSTEHRRFLVAFKQRHSSALERIDAINAAVNGVLSITPDWKVSGEEPCVTISLQVIQSVCCVSILQRQVDFCKYNLQEVLNLTTNELVAAQ